jgi:hypothetical protein
MTKYEYQIVHNVTLEKLMTQLNSLGQEGWEAVGISVETPNFTPTAVLLKRNKE